MATYNIKQGESKAVELAIYENDSAVDMSAAIDVKVLFYIKGIEVAKYSLTTETGYGVLEIKPTPDEHIAICELTRAQSKMFPTGYLSASIVIKWNDAILDDGLIKEFDLAVGQVFAGLGKDEILA